LEHQLVAQTKEAEMLSRRVQELESRLSEQSRLLAEREFQREQLAAELDSARKSEADLRAELSGYDSRSKSRTETLRAEKEQLEAELARTREERAQLQREITTIKRDAEASWATERVENALLRERINDIAAEVARLTSVIEGPNSPIEAILAEDAARPASDIAFNGEGAPMTAPPDPKGNLAERIRALQQRASRVPTTTTTN
jgi:chromosome segregation ATPase